MHSWYPILGYALVFLLLKPVLAHVLLFSRIRKFRLSAPSLSSYPGDDSARVCERLPECRA